MSTPRTFRSGWFRIASSSRRRANPAMAARLLNSSALGTKPTGDCVNFGSFLGSGTSWNCLFTSGSQSHLRQRKAGDCIDQWQLHVEISKGWKGLNCRVCGRYAATCSRPP
eukprot:EG_transcript_36987